jgi:hypothetical protein
LKYGLVIAVLAMSAACSPAQQSARPSASRQQLDYERAERDRLVQEQIDRTRTERLQLEREQAERDRRYREQSLRAQSEREALERARAENERRDSEFLPGSQPGHQQFENVVR